ncbi:MAG TPA: hypothetical protein VFP05_09690 [Thermomicrobiales bacterium]|nr:hypothetical protein [Thermomicrobiales bacterium]
MSSSLQTVLEQPLRFSTGAFQAIESTNDGRSAVLLREVSLIDSGMTPQPATLMAVATDRAEGAGPERAERALERFQTSVVEGTQTDMAARLKSAFRAANQDVFGLDPGEVSMVAMVARGKYASFAAVGDNQAILYRADRINQITRNQRVERTNSRRSGQRTLDTSAGPQFLGAQERLESRLPAIFDITLLPLDAVALLSGAVAEQLAQGSMTSALVVPGQSFATAIERRVLAEHDPAGAATVLEVLPAREALPEPPEAVLTTPTFLPYLIIGIVLIVGLLAVLWFFFVR